MLGTAIVIGLVGILAVFILLKICSTRPVLNTVLIFCACIGLLVTSFAMPVEKVNGSVQFDWNWVLGQAVCLFLSIVLTCSEFAFEEEDYVQTDAYVDYGGNYHETSKLATRTMFWTVLGTSLGATIVLVIINYVIFDSGIGLGILGAIMTAVMTFITVKHWVARYRKKHGKSFY